MRYSQFTPYDLVLLLQGLAVTVGLFLLTSAIGIVIAPSGRRCASIGYRCSPLPSPSWRSF